LTAVLERGGILKLILIYRLRIDLGSIAKNLPSQKGIKRRAGQHCLPRMSPHSYWNGRFTRLCNILKKLAPAGAAQQGTQPASPP
jgi:hypothetical protein